MISEHVNILLADDDKDDCLFFKEALDELQLHTTLTTVHDGEQLMRLLKDTPDNAFHVLFLDLNMPRKNGFTCLEEIKRSNKLKSLPVIIFSTSYDEHIADQLYKNGAHHYICKPADFSHLKKIILQAITLIIKNSDERNRTQQPPKEKFLLNTLRTILL